MIHGAAPLLVTLAAADPADPAPLVTLELPYAAWTHPRGCLGPYAGDRVVLGDPVFRRSAPPRNAQ